MERRVVITGMGAITPLGNNISDFWENIKAGNNGIAPITRFDTSNFKVKIAAEVKDFDATKYFEKKDIKRYDLFCQFAIGAATEAIADSQLPLEEIDRDRFGVIVSSGIGGLTTMEEQIIKMNEKGSNRVSPLFVPLAIENMAAGNIAIAFGARGVCTSVVTACASGTNSIGEAFRAIKHGYADVMLTGGSEASINQIGIAGFTNITALTQSEDIHRASIPFDKDRSGFVMGEGAGILVLEDLEHAQKRNAKIYAEVVGYGSTCDAFHMTAPSPDGSGGKKAMVLAMQEAGIQPEDVQYINAHGTSTPANDSSETKAIHEAFGAHAEKLLISSTKSMIGHLLGGAGAVEAIACVKTLQEGIVTPTIGYQNPDPECDLNYVPNVAVKADVRYVLTNSLGFGGHNAVLCLKKWEDK